MTATAPKPRQRTTMVELLDWTYRRQKADIMTGRSLHVPNDVLEAEGIEDGMPYGVSADGCAMVERILTEGAIIPGTSHLQAPTVDDDAAAVHDAVVALSQSDWLGAMLIRRYARSGEPPKPLEVRRWDARSYDRRGKPVTAAEVIGWERAANNRRVILEAEYTPIEPWPGLPLIKASRAEYLKWRLAVVKLMWLLRQGEPLRRWIVADVGAARRAW
ncbi:hypothetical protein [Magnetospirillum aberrantis]|uniref:Uncharacterized protein n=1 Tax=Magnetospirillum aberrantis SpK TaxID=908842 RepID=A0A7C9UYU6_9PROT|nr:hypothetical protein [Magnetospirillum aberrantis]NFV80013.1 hypothetical protein [Magnetospirillum aberrantis SpK]